MHELYEQLKTILDSVEQDVEKSAKGNRAAGTRVRKQMQELKKTAQELRMKVVEVREGD